VWASGGRHYKRAVIAEIGVGDTFQDEGRWKGNDHVSEFSLKAHKENESGKKKKPKRNYPGIL